MRIEWAEEASAELDRMLAYIAAQDVSAAALVAERVLQAEQNILTFRPLGGMTSPQTHSTASSQRADCADLRPTR